MSHEDQANARPHQFDTGTDWPNPDDARTRIDLIRTGKKNGWSITATPLSHDVYKFTTHYVGRTVGCVKRWATCPHCKEGINERWSGYLPVWWTNKQKFAILDITSGIATHLRLYREQHGSLRGSVLTVERERDKATKPVELRQIKPLKPEQLLNVPAEFDTIHQLFKIWQMRQPKELLRERELQRTHAEQLNSILAGRTALTGLTPDEQAIQQIVESLPIRKQA